MKKVFVFLFLLSSSVVVLSQSLGNEFGKKISYGFNLGFNYSLLHSPNQLPENYGIENGAGFVVGIIMDYKLTNRLSFSPKGELSFNNSVVTVIDGENTSRSMKYPASIDLMPHIVYRLGNSKTIPYLLIGPNIQLPIHDKKEIKNEIDTKSYFAIDFGFGIENRLKYFFLSPEIRYSLGLGDVNKSTGLPSLRFSKISLMLNFR